jgi:hypothetical protein
MTKHVKPPRIDADQFRAYGGTGLDLIPLNMPLATKRGKDGKTRKIGKAPRDKLWVTRDYKRDQVVALCIRESRNMGTRLRRDDLVIDVDPRNGGNESLAKLAKMLKLNIKSPPRVATGADGLHLFGKKPPGLKINTKLADFPGLEFKTYGSQVVCGGSVHPDTLKRYTMTMFDPPDAGVMWPGNLLEFVARKPREAGTGDDGVLYQPDDLANMLARIPYSAVDDYHEWLKLMMACHHVTDANGVDVFVDWNAKNPDHPDCEDLIREKWDGFTTDRAPGDSITAGTLYKFLTDAGAADLIPRISAEDDFNEPVDGAWLEGGPDAADDFKPRKKIVFSPFVLGDPKLLPPRDWIYKPVYLRKFLSLTTALGGTGKSSIVMTEAVAMASGKALLGIEPVKRLRVVYWNGEDPEDEIDRHLHAICQHYELSKPDVERYLFRDSGRILPIKIARTKNGTTQIATPIVDELHYALKDQNIDAMIIDPFVASHAATENDNNAMEIVAKKWSHIADAGDLSIHVVHHNRKPAGGAVGTIDDARGGTALINAARVRRAFNKMTDAQAKAAGIDPARRGFYISADLANTNVAKPAAALDWYELKSVNLGNGTKEQDADDIGVPVVFEYVAMEAVEATPEQTDAVLKALRQRDDWRGNVQSPDWIGHAIGTAMGLILDGDTHKAERAQVKKMIADWLKDGTLIEYEGLDARSNKRAFLKVNDPDFG